VVKYLKPGQDFSANDFPKEFGFRGSAVGPRSHPRIEPDPYDDGLAGPKRNVREPVNPRPKRLAVGGPAMPPGGAPPAAAAPPQGGPLGALSMPSPNGGQEPTITMPMSTAANVAKHLVQTGAMHGAAAGAQAIARHVARHRAAPMAPSAPPAPSPDQAPQAGMAKGGNFIAKAVNRPGRETQRAHVAGRSVHDQMEHDKHSSDPSLRSAANLGLRLTKGDLSPHRKKGR
jgi:hypothetical protein